MASGFPKRFDPVRKSLKLPEQELKGILMSEASVKIKER